MGYYNHKYNVNVGHWGVWRTGISTLLTAIMFIHKMYLNEDLLNTIWICPSTSDNLLTAEFLGEAPLTDCGESNPCKWFYGAQAGFRLPARLDSSQFWWSGSVGRFVLDSDFKTFGQAERLEVNLQILLDRDISGDSSALKNV